MTGPNYRGPVGKYIEDTQQWERSPFIRGLLSGTKSALMAAPIGAAVQAIRGKNALVGALVGALGAGLTVGISRAVDQDVKNQIQEGDLKFYAERLKESEPLVFMPPAPMFGKLFSKMHASEHVRNARVIAE